MKKRITFVILFACIILVTKGCSSGETELVRLEKVEMRPSNQFSSEIDGLWTGVVDGLDGEKLELNYRFKAEGTRLIGLIESRLGGGPISEGKIDGENIEFKLHAGEDLIIINHGTLYGDEFHITQTIGEEKIKVILERVKK